MLTSIRSPASVLFASLILGLAINARAQSVTTCMKQQPSEPILFTQDFKWGYNMQEMTDRFKQIYAGEKRLQNRAYYDAAEKTYVMELDSGSGFKKIRLKKNFVDSVTRHIEISLSRHYGDFVFFPDMGHSHLHIPDALWAQISNKPMDQIYEEAFKTKTLKILYHTAEQLSMRDGERQNGPVSSDPYLQMRYYYRNVMGQNDASDNVQILYAFGEKFNTVRDVPGYRNFGGFNISANKNGCFQYEVDGVKYNYDISMNDLPSNMSGGDNGVEGL